MPPYKHGLRKRPKRGKKRGRRRRGRKFAKTTYTNRVVKVHSAMPLPRKFTCKHRYVESVIPMDPSGVAPAIYSFRANSLYDPNFTGVGHQPMGFDNIMPFYNHYTVIGSRIRVKFINADTTNMGPIVGIYMNGQSAPTLTDWQTLAEQGNITYGYIQTNSNNTSANELTLTSKFSARKFFGRRGILTEDDFRGTSATNPAEEAFFHIFVAPRDNVTNIGITQILVEMEYIAVYTELKQLAGS